MKYVTLNPCAAWPLILLLELASASEVLSGHVIEPYIDWNQAQQRESSEEPYVKILNEHAGCRKVDNIDTRPNIRAHNSDDEMKYDWDMTKATTIYLAGYDDQIVKLMSDIRNQGQGHELLVYFYLYTNLNYHNLGSFYTDKKVLRDNIVKYTHYFCMDNNTTRGTWCLDNLDITHSKDSQPKVQIVQELDTEPENKSNGVCTPVMSAQHIHHTEKNDAYKFTIPKENDVNFDDIHIDLLKTEHPKILAENQILLNTEKDTVIEIPDTIHATSNATGKDEYFKELSNKMINVDANMKNDDNIHVSTDSLNMDKGVTRNNEDNSVLYEIANQEMNLEHNPVNYLPNVNVFGIDATNSNQIHKPDISDGIVNIPEYNLMQANNKNFITDNKDGPISSYKDIATVDSDKKEISENEGTVIVKELNEIELDNKSNSKTIQNIKPLTINSNEIRQLTPCASIYHTPNTMQSIVPSNMVPTAIKTLQPLTSYIIDSRPYINYIKTNTINGAITSSMSAGKNLDNGIKYKVDSQIPSKQLGQNIYTNLNNIPNNGDLKGIQHQVFRNGEAYNMIPKPCNNVNYKSLVKNPISFFAPRNYPSTSELNNFQNKPMLQNYYRNNKINVPSNQTYDIDKPIAGDFSANSDFYANEIGDTDNVKPHLHTSTRKPTHPIYKNLVKYLEPNVNQKSKGILDASQFQLDSKHNYGSLPGAIISHLSGKKLPEIVASLKTSLSDKNQTINKIEEKQYKTTKARDYFVNQICSDPARLKSMSTRANLPYYGGKFYTDKPSYSLKKNSILAPYTYKNILTLEGNVPNTDIITKFPTPSTSLTPLSWINDNSVTSFEKTNTAPNYPAKTFSSLRFNLNKIPLNQYNTYLSNTPQLKEKLSATDALVPHRSKLCELSNNNYDHIALNTANNEIPQTVRTETSFINRAHNVSGIGNLIQPIIQSVNYTPSTYEILNPGIPKCIQSKKLNTKYPFRTPFTFVNLKSKPTLPENIPEDYVYSSLTPNSIIKTLAPNATIDSPSSVSPMEETSATPHSSSTTKSLLPYQSLLHFVEPNPNVYEVTTQKPNLFSSPCSVSGHSGTTATQSSMPDLKANYLTHLKPSVSTKYMPNDNGAAISTTLISPTLMEEKLFNRTDSHTPVSIPVALLTSRQPKIVPSLIQGSKYLSKPTSYYDPNASTLQLPLKNYFHDETLPLNTLSYLNRFSPVSTSSFPYLKTLPDHTKTQGIQPSVDLKIPSYSSYPSPIGIVNRKIQLKPLTTNSILTPTYLKPNANAKLVHPTENIPTRFLKSNTMPSQLLYKLPRRDGVIANTSPALLHLKTSDESHIHPVKDVEPLLVSPDYNIIQDKVKTDDKSPIKLIKHGNYEFDPLIKNKIPSTVFDEALVHTNAIPTLSEKHILTDYASQPLQGSNFPQNLNIATASLYNQISPFHSPKHLAQQTWTHPRKSQNGELLKFSNNILHGISPALPLTRETNHWLSNGLDYTQFPTNFNLAAHLDYINIPSKLHSAILTDSNQGTQPYFLPINGHLNKYTEPTDRKILPAKFNPSNIYNVNPSPHSLLSDSQANIPLSLSEPTQTFYFPHEWTFTTTAPSNTIPPYPTHSANNLSLQNQRICNPPWKIQNTDQMRFYGEHPRICNSFPLTYKKSYRLLNQIPGGENPTTFHQTADLNSIKTPLSKALSLQSKVVPNLNQSLQTPCILPMNNLPNKYNVFPTFPTPNIFANQPITKSISSHIFNVNPSSILYNFTSTSASLNKVRNPLVDFSPLHFDTSAASSQGFLKYKQEQHPLQESKIVTDAVTKTSLPQLTSLKPPITSTNVFPTNLSFAPYSFDFAANPARVVPYDSLDYRPRVASTSDFFPNLAWSSLLPHNSIFTDNKNTLLDSPPSRIFNFIPNSRSRNVIPCTIVPKSNSEPDTLSYAISNPMLQGKFLTKRPLKYNYFTPKPINSEYAANTKPYSDIITQYPSNFMGQTMPIVPTKYKSFNDPTISFPNTLKAVSPIPLNRETISLSPTTYTTWTNMKDDHKSKSLLSFLKPLPINSDFEHRKFTFPYPSSLPSYNPNTHTPLLSTDHRPYSLSLQQNVTPNFQKPPLVTTPQSTYGPSLSHIYEPNLEAKLSLPRLISSNNPVLLSPLSNLPYNYGTQTPNEEFTSISQSNLFSNNYPYSKSDIPSKGDNVCENIQITASNALMKPKDQVYLVANQNQPPTNPIDNINCNLNQFIKDLNVLPSILSERTIVIPLQNVGIAKYEPTKLDKVVLVKTENPHIDLKAWPTAVRVVKARIVLDCDVLYALNFLPVVKKGLFTTKAVQDAAREFVTKSYGVPIIVKGMYNLHRPYAVVEDVKEEAIRKDKIYIIWPNICTNACHC